MIYKHEQYPKNFQNNPKRQKNFFLKGSKKTNRIIVST